MYVYVYDLSQGMARMLSGQLLGQQIDGIWHTAIVVYGKEFAFGQGVSAFPMPGCTPYGNPVEKKFLGNTTIDEDTFLQFIQDMGHRFNEYSYDLLENNCNNFSEEAAVFLTGCSIPDYVRNLTRTVLNSPMGQMLKPFLDQFRNPHNLGHESFSNSQQYPVPAPSRASSSSASNADASLRPILLNTGNLPIITQKLQEYLEAQGLAEGAASRIAALREGIQKNQVQDPATMDWLLHLLEVLPEAKLFPVLDLLRLTFISSESVDYFLSSHGPLLDRVFALAQSPVTALRLTGLRVLVNMFSSETGAKSLRTEFADQAFSCATHGLSPDQSLPCKECACALGFNLVLGRELEASDHELELISSVCMALDTTSGVELKPQAAEKMLEFAKVMLKNETHRELWDTMQVDLEAIKALEGAKPSLLKLVEDVQKLLPTQQS